jgi:hypothetical protein
MSSGELRLGMLGMSEGNGHPYSWSAICNGYDPVAMASCPFPVIPGYLSQQVFPEARIAGARVTHVWAQDRSIAQHIAAASLIPTVVDSYEAMIGDVDAILLARDDAENHLEMSAPFLDAGLPIYIDKPIALSIGDLDRLYAHQRYPGQVFSCSALRYSADFQLTAQMLAQLGEIRHIEAEVPRTWQKYGVHVVEPVLNMFGLYGRECDVRSNRLGDVHVVTADWGALSASFRCLGSQPGEIRIRLLGTLAQRELTVTDTYLTFKRTLSAFFEGIESRREMIPRQQLYSIVSILEKGMAHGN